MTFKTNQPVSIRSIVKNNVGIIKTNDVMVTFYNHNGLYFKHGLSPITSTGITTQDKALLLESLKGNIKGVYTKGSEYIYSEDKQTLQDNIPTLVYVETRREQYIL